MAMRLRRMWRRLSVIWLFIIIVLITYEVNHTKIITEVGIGRITSSASFTTRLNGAELITTSDLDTWFECRLLGPKGCIIVCEVSRLESHRYWISSSPVPLTGSYSVILTIAHIGKHGDNPTAPITTQYEGIKLSGRHTVYIKASSERCIPYWKSRFQYVDCYNVPEPKLPNVLKTPIILFGDSHMRGWRDVLSGSQGVTTPYQRFDGLLSPGGAGSVSYIRAEGLKITHKLNSTVIPSYLQYGFLHTFYQLNQLKVKVLELQSTTSQSVVVAVNLGSWDMRDVGVEEYCSNLVIFEKKFSELGLYNLNMKLIWRSTPSYTYKGKNYRTTDLRTNEKIKLANICARDILSKWIHHDTFAITHPVFLDSCDSHHYLCPPSKNSPESCPLMSTSDKTIAIGCSGKADLLAFLKLAYFDNR